MGKKRSGKERGNVGNLLREKHRKFGNMKL